MANSSFPPSLGGGSSSESHFDPDQPRVPAGQAGGGQWTSLAALLGAEGASDARDGGLPFGADGAPGSRLPPDAAQLAFSGSEANVLPRAPGVRRLFRTQPLRPADAIRLYELLSAADGPDGQAVLDLRAYGFTRDASGEFNFTHAFVERLSREQVKKECRKFQDVQDLLDATYKQVLIDHPDFDRGRIGTEVHLRMKNQINNNSKLSATLRAEVSYVAGQKEPEPNDNKNYAGRDTVRPDIREKSASSGQPEHEKRISLGAALERLTHDTVCFYELTIGQRDMTASRAFKLGEMTRAAFKGEPITRFIVLQMRPSSWRRRR